MFDIIIEKGHIIDGAGNPWFNADVGIANGKIVKIGQLAGQAASERIDAEKLIVSPGFIDIHCHMEGPLFLTPREDGRICQGITTEIIGNCGMSAAPVLPETSDLLKTFSHTTFGSLPWNWRSVSDFFARVEERQTTANIGTLVGHGTIRIAAMGFDNREPTPAELTAMKQSIKEAMAEGAFGLSSGLAYPPGLFSSQHELIELCKIVAQRQGIYTTHMRNETDEVIDYVAESIEVGEKSGVSLEISHHKTAGTANWGKSQQTLKMIEEARRRGLDINCDVYPYAAASTMLRSLLPPWAHEGGVSAMLEKIRKPELRQRMKADIANGLPTWENLARTTGWGKIMIGSCQKSKELEGKTIQEIALARNVEPPEAVFDILLEEEANVSMIMFMMAEEDVTNILKHPAAMVASDAFYSTGKPHPRFYGSFPRVLGKYVRTDKALTLAEGIRKMTSMPAQKLGLRDRGLLKEGMWADITIFDPETIEDKATFMEPVQHPVGIRYVLVNGRVSVRDGKYTGMLAGKVIRKNG